MPKPKVLVRVPLDTFYADLPEPSRPHNMISMLMTEIAAQTVDSCNITVPQDKNGRVHKTSTTALVFVTLLVYLIQIGAATKLLMNGRSYDYKILQNAVCTVPLRRPERAGSQCCRHGQARCEHCCIRHDSRVRAGDQG